MIKKVLYKIKWKQNYHDWYHFVDMTIENLLKSSDMKEAKKVIERIKNGYIS